MNQFYFLCLKSLAIMKKYNSGAEKPESKALQSTHCMTLNPHDQKECNKSQRGSMQGQPRAPLLPGERP